MMMPRHEEGVSIVVPTFREVDNLALLVQGIDEIRRELPNLELIIVDDDSQDGTEALLNTLCTQHDWLRFYVRKGRRDLASAVIDGFRAARFPVLVCMDADLSHPIAKIPSMVKALHKNPNADMVIGSRFAPGGRVDVTWSRLRRLNARVARLIARPFTAVKDPMSGFFAIQKPRFEGAKELNPIGYKIGLELIVRCPCKNVIEIPIDFSERRHGHSKLTFKEQTRYLVHVTRLLSYKTKCWIRT